MQFIYSAHDSNETHRTRHTSDSVGFKHDAGRESASV